MKKSKNISVTSSHVRPMVANDQVWPKISIVTPSFNQGQFIEETILSVKSQDYNNFEHIIVDGKSTDETLSILDKYRNTYDLRIVCEPDEGQSDAINKGFALSEGDIIGWINSDDVLYSRDVLSKVANIFRTHPMVDAIYSNRIAIDGGSMLLKIQYCRDFDYDKLLKSYYGLFQETVFLRRKIIKEEKINTILQVVMDREYWLRLGKKYRFLYVDDFFGCFRIHNTNKTVIDSYLLKWNREKQFLIRTYHAREYMYGKGFPWQSLMNRIKAIFTGSFNKYYKLPYHVFLLCFFKPTHLSFPLGVNKKSLLRYIIRSVTPYIR